MRLALTPWLNHSWHVPFYVTARGLGTSPIPVGGDIAEIEFDFVDLSGSDQRGHMAHAVFNIIDANHHTEQWTYMLPGDKPMVATMNLTRAK